VPVECQNDLGPQESPIGVPLDQRYYPTMLMRHPTFQAENAGTILVIWSKRATPQWLDHVVMRTGYAKGPQATVTDSQHNLSTTFSNNSRE